MTSLLIGCLFTEQTPEIIGEYHVIYLAGHIDRGLVVSHWIVPNTANND